MEMRTTKPGAGNKYYIRKAQGGWSNAIFGKPTDSECNVLANCVGYAYGRFNEIGGYGYCKYLAPVNAENFMSYKGSCKTGMTPRPGAVMVWEGAGSHPGHVAIVEKVYDNNHVYTSESGYGSKAFWNQHRYNNNGRWGCSSNYRFLGFIYNPAVKVDETPANSTKTIEQLAKEVINGDWGNGEDRKNRLTAAGYDYSAVQARVNELVAKPAPKPSKSIDQLAKEVINGDWGNGADRKARLTNAGYDYSAVQNRVNEMLAGSKPASNVVTYTVKGGDTLYGIARKILGNGNRWPEIYNANKAVIGSNPNIIRAGQVLKIKK